MSFKRRNEADLKTIATQNQRLPLVKDGKATQMTGTKYKYGTRKDVSSYMDAKRIERNLEERALNLGHGGVRYAILDKDGKPDKDAVQNIDGRLFRADGIGSFFKSDGTYLAEMVKEQKERMEYVKQLMGIASVSNEAMAALIGVPVDEIPKMCGADKAQKYFGDFIVSTEIDNANCEPDFLATVDPSSIFASQGYTKLRRIIEHIMPIVENMTALSHLNDGVEA